MEISFHLLYQTHTGMTKIKKCFCKLQTIIWDFLALKKLDLPNTFLRKEN